MDELQELPTRLVGKDEMNLADFAIGVIRDSGAQPCTEKSIVRSQVVKTAQGLLTQEWTVTASGRYGFPHPADDDVLLGLIHLAAQNRYASQTVRFSRYGLCRLMGWSHKGQNFERVEEALHRLSGVKVNAKHSFYDGKLKRYVSKVFGIIDSFTIAEQVGGPALQSEAKFSDELWKSMESNHVKPLDLKVYYGLRSPIARRLYRYLDKRKLNRKSFELELESLARVNIGIDTSKRIFPSQLKQSFESSHRELLKIGFLQDVRYKVGSNKKLRVCYTFAHADQAAPSSEFPAGVNQPEVWLTQRGVGPRIARQLARDFPERIEALTDFFDFVMKTSPNTWKHPVGWLVQAVKEDYQVPSSWGTYVPLAERERRAQEQQAQTNQQQAAEQAAISRELTRAQRLSELGAGAVDELFTYVRSKSIWAKKLTPDHPAMKAAMIEALESGEWEAVQVAN